MNRLQQLDGIDATLGIARGMLSAPGSVRDGFAERLLAIVEARAKACREALTVASNDPEWRAKKEIATMYRLLGLGE